MTKNPHCFLITTVQFQSKDVIKNDGRSPNGLSWGIPHCYALLAKLGEFDQSLLDKVLEKLGREWLLSTNEHVDKMLENITLSLHAKHRININGFRRQVLDMIGSEHLKAIIPDFKSLEKLFDSVSILQRDGLFPVSVVERTEHTLTQDVTTHHMLH